MATELTQDSVLQFIRSGGGSVKNSELIQHYRNFIRDHAERDRNRELFKKFVNSVATVQQLDGVSFVVLRRKFKGRVPPGGGGGGSPGPLGVPAGRSTEPSSEGDRLSPMGRAEKTGQKAQQREAITPAPAGEPAGITVLPAAGFILNNNNNTVETNLNLKQVTRPPEVSVRPAEKTPSLSEPNAPEQLTRVGQPRLDPGPPPGVTPVVRPSQQVPQPPRGREAYLPPGGLHQDPPLHHISRRSEEPPLHHEIRHPQDPPLHHISHRSEERPLHHVSRHPQEPPLHHISRHPQGPPLHHFSRHPQGPPLHRFSRHPQGPPLHHFSRHPQEPRLHHFSPQEPHLHHASRHPREPPLHHASRHPQEPPLHHFSPQEPHLHHASRHPQEPPLHHASRHPQEPPLHHFSHHPQEPPLHHISRHPQEPPLHHASGHPQLALQPEGGFHQEPPLHHISLHQEPPLHHTSCDPQVALQPEGDLHQDPPLHHIRPHQEPPLHHASRDPQVALQPEGDPHQEPPLHHISHQPEVALQPEEGLHQEPPLHHISHQPEVALQPEEGLHQEPPPPHTSLQVAPRRARHRQSYKSAVSYDDEEEEEEEEVPLRRGSAGGAWPLSTPLGDVSRAISTSSPCIIDQPAPPSEASSSSERKLPQIYIQDVKGEVRPPGEPSPDRSAQKDRRYSQPAGVQLEPRGGLDQNQRAGLSSSHSSVFSQSSDTGVPSSDWPPPGSPRGPRRNSSYEDLLARTDGSKIQEVLQRAQRTKLDSETHHADNKTTVPWHHSAGDLHDNQESPAYLSPIHHSTGNLYDDQPTARALPWHLSTGDLYDRDETESSDGSTSSPPLRKRPGVARRLSSQLRNRMCLSLGADLDQLLHEETRGEAAGGGNEAARLNRLHMISSSLSLRYNLSSSSLSSCSTPPRCNSLADLAEGVEGKRGRRSLPTASTAHSEGSSRQSVVPLEDREHAWLVKGAAGAWPDIYSLFREDSSLLNRRDFISGFTVLHWIAKHGDHRVLNTLWYGVQKAGLTFDINARSTCGHTPLHIAAMHGHKNIMRLLVGKFNADVKLRDTAGKKPWQYLSRPTSVDVFQLLGAPPRAAVSAEGGVGRADSAWKPDPHHHHQRRRRRHHLSSASGERPLTIAGTVKVKRSSSLAAFLKHKSMLRFHGHQSESSM